MTDDAVSDLARAADDAEDVDVVVVGSGLTGYMVAAELAPRIGSERVVVVDSESWLTECAGWIDRLEVGLIDGRSALADALRVATRSPQLARGGVPLEARAALDRCARSVTELDLDRCWRPARVAWLVPVCGGRLTLVQLADGRQLRAHHVVLAPGTQYRVIPHWVEDLIPQPTNRLLHADDLDLRLLDLAGEDVAVVGSVDMALHLALGALRHGASRAEVITGAPVRIRADGKDGSAPDRLRVHPGARIIAASASTGRSELVLGDEQRIDVDRVWFATGAEVDLLADRSLRFVRELLPADPATGVALDSELRWPGSTIHVVGPAVTRAGHAGAADHWDRIATVQLVARSIERSLSVCGAPVVR